MELLTTGAPIVEQTDGGSNSVAIPKQYIKDRDLKGKDILHMMIEKTGNQLLVTYTEYYRGGSKKRSIMKSGEYYRINLPQSDYHERSSWWKAYTDNKGLLQYELVN